MGDFISAVTTAKVIAGTWFMKELFSFFLRLRKQDEEERRKNDRPDEEWKNYCIQKFETICEKVNQIFTAQKVIDVKIAHLEKTIKGIRQ